MKILLNLCSAASVACLMTITASDLGITAPVAVVGKSDGGVVRKTEGRPAPKASFAAPVVFNAHARSKVVQYFDTYRSEPLGLPPGCAATGSGAGLPAGWNGPGISSGGVIPESERAFLVEVPVEMVKVLAAQSEVEVRYFLAGGSLVAVDPGWKVLDSVRIPTVRLAGERELVMVRHLGR